jgi:hypothetical protein
VPKFNPIIRRARFVAGDISADTMLKIGVDVRNSVRDRIREAKDVYDHLAPPLAQTLRPVWKHLRKGELAGTKYQNRILRVEHINKLTYPHYKVVGKDAQGRRYNGKPIRDWHLTGTTLRAMQVLSAAPNRVRIGFDDSGPRGPKQDPPSLIAAANKVRWPQFGMSPRDKAVAERSLLAHTEPVKIVTKSA